MAVFEEVAESLNQKIQEAEKAAGSFDENDQASSLLVSMVSDLKFSLKYTQEAWKSWSEYTNKLANFKTNSRLKKQPNAPKCKPPYPDVDVNPLKASNSFMANMAQRTFPHERISAGSAGGKMY